MPVHSAGHDAASDTTDVMTRISQVGHDLCTCFDQLLQPIPQYPQGATELARALGVSRIVVHRLLTAIHKRDPLATAHLIPGPEPLRRIVRETLQHGADQRHVTTTERAIDQFERLIRHVAGDRSALDAIICSSLPDARERFETEAKQNAFRGMRQLKGVAADVAFTTFVMHPSEENEDRHDFVAINGYLGLRCIRPNAGLKLGVRSGVSNPRALPRTLDGEPMSGPHERFLRKYCTDEAVQLKLFEFGQDIAYVLDWGRSVGLESSRDVIMAELRLAAMRRHRLPELQTPYTSFTDDIMVPTRMYIFDLLFHDDVYPDWQPEARIIETGLAGHADPNDPTRDLDELNLMNRVEELGWGIDNVRAEDIPDYMAILNDVCTKRNWARERFRGYRLRMQYPVYSTQVQIRFELPEQPGS